MIMRTPPPPPPQHTHSKAVTHFSDFLPTNICLSTAPTAGARLLKLTVKMDMNVVF
jgi:hypothetical protein